MRRIPLALLWFGCAPAAFATPAAAFYTIDPITRDPIYYGQVQRRRSTAAGARELPLDREL